MHSAIFRCFFSFFSCRVLPHFRCIFSPLLCYLCVVNLLEGWAAAGVLFSFNTIPSRLLLSLLAAPRLRLFIFPLYFVFVLYSMSAVLSSFLLHFSVSAGDGVAVDFLARVAIGCSGAAGPRGWPTAHIDSRPPRPARRSFRRFTFKNKTREMQGILWRSFACFTRSLSLPPRPGPDATISHTFSQYKRRRPGSTGRRSKLSRRCGSFFFHPRRGARSLSFYALPLRPSPVHRERSPQSSPLFLTRLAAPLARRRTPMAPAPFF